LGYFGTRGTGVGVGIVTRANATYIGEKWIAGLVKRAVAKSTEAKLIYDGELAHKGDERKPQGRVRR
jgi:hypothetical protein